MDELQCVDDDKHGKGCVNPADVKQVINSPKNTRKGYLQSYSPAERSALKEQAKDMGYPSEVVQSAIGDDE